MLPLVAICQTGISFMMMDLNETHEVQVPAEASCGNDKQDLLNQGKTWASSATG